MSLRTAEGDRGFMAGYADEILRDEHAKILTSNEFVQMWARPYDLAGLIEEPGYALETEGYMGMNLRGKGVITVRQDEVGCFVVGIFRDQDLVNPSLRFRQRFPETDDLHRFLSDLHQRTGLLSHPLEPRVPGIIAPPEYEQAVQRYRLIGRINPTVQ